jgi:putative transposase
MGTRLNRSNRRAVLHYVTINVRNRRKAFQQDIFARAAAEVLRRHCDEHPARLIAYVIMPEHLHFITNPRDGDINRFLSQYKPAVTLRVKELAEEFGRQRILDWLRMPNGEYHLWQDGKHNLHLYSDRLIWQKINYIHEVIAD